MNNIELVNYCKNAINTDNYYVYGTFGQKLTSSLIEYKIKQYPSFYRTQSRINGARNAVGKYGFDCVGLIKSFVWGGYGNIKYNASQDVSANGMYNRATEKGEISSIPQIPGILVWMSGHIGVYDGKGYVYESTISNSKYKIIKTNLMGRGWKKWCKCPFIEYSDSYKQPTNSANSNENTHTDGKKEVIRKLQHAYNVSYKTNLVEDGIIGPKTIAVMKKYYLKNFTENELARWVQDRLVNHKHYNIAIDGKYGKNTEATVEQFQHDNGLKADGYAGYNTISILI